MFKGIIVTIQIFFSSLFGGHIESPLQTTSSLPSQKILISTSTRITKATSSPIQKNIQEKTTPIIKKPVEKEIVIPKQPITTPPPVTPPIITEPAFTFDQINDLARPAVVNIFCTTPTGSLSPITATGIIVSDTGIVLTNAHIAQYFLLKDFNGQKDFISCVLRTGNPAYPTYTTELVYVSPEWVAEHKNDIISTDAKGTGEYDFAFLQITGRVDKKALPSNLPFINPNIKDSSEIGTQSLLISYPAGFLGGQTIVQSLYQSSAITTISDRYTFASTTIDLISVGGTVVSQKGSSGGAVIDVYGKLIGIITTSSEDTSTKNRDLRAITLPYIERDLLRSTGYDLLSFIEHVDAYKTNFEKNIAPKLTQTLTDVILKK
jgi:S1-C subfamily serine protease